MHVPSLSPSRPAPYRSRLSGAGAALLTDVGDDARRGLPYALRHGQEVPVVGVAPIEGGDGLIEPGHRVVERLGVARFGV